MSSDLTLYNFSNSFIIIDEKIIIILMYILKNDEII